MKETQTCLLSIALEMHALVGNPVVEMCATNIWLTDTKRETFHC